MRERWGQTNFEKERKAKKTKEGDGWLGFFSRRVAQRASCRVLASQHASSEGDSGVDCPSHYTVDEGSISFHTCGTTGIFASRASTLVIAFQLDSLHRFAPRLLWRGCAELVLPTGSINRQKQRAERRKRRKENRRTDNPTRENRGNLIARYYRP